MSKPISRETGSLHYKWGDNCDGWVVVNQPRLSVISESMPSGTAEHRHHHVMSRQFFYVLTGVLTMEIEGVVHQILAGAGIEIDPEARHQARNESGASIEFLVISQPSTRGDRVDEV